MTIGSGSYNTVIENLNAALQTQYDAWQDAEEGSAEALEAQQTYETTRAQAKAIDDAAGGDSGIEIPEAV